MPLAGHFIFPRSAAKMKHAAFRMAVLLRSSSRSCLYIFFALHNLIFTTRGDGHKNRQTFHVQKPTLLVVRTFPIPSKRDAWDGFVSAWFLDVLYFVVPMSKLTIISVVTVPTPLPRQTKLCLVFIHFTGFFILPSTPGNVLLCLLRSCACRCDTFPTRCPRKFRRQCAETSGKTRSLPTSTDDSPDRSSRP